MFEKLSCQCRLHKPTYRCKLILPTEILWVYFNQWLLRLCIYGYSLVIHILFTSFISRESAFSHLISVSWVIISHYFGAKGNWNAPARDRKLVISEPMKLLGLFMPNQTGIYDDLLAAGFDGYPTPHT